MSEKESESTDLRPRLCHLRRWTASSGFGFNLQYEKTKPGQYIGKVDANSSAASAGLREYDRIIEVNSVPIGNENHKQTVQRIKQGVSRNGKNYTDEVILLVVDPKTDEYYKSKAMIITSSDPNVIKLETQKKNSSSIHSSDTNEDDSPRPQHKPIQKMPNEFNQDYKHVTDFTRPTAVQTPNTDKVASYRPYEENYENSDDYDGYTKPKQLNSDKEKNSAMYQMPSVPSAHTNESNNLLNLSKTAAEYRAQLNSKGSRKRDVRQNEQMSLKQKYEMINRL